MFIRWKFEYFAQTSIFGTMSGLLSAYLLVDQYLAESILLIARFWHYLQ